MNRWKGKLAIDAEKAPENKLDISHPVQNETETHVEMKPFQSRTGLASRSSAVDLERHNQFNQISSTRAFLHRWPKSGTFPALLP